ncbi:glycosyltransferase [Promethearchaeum syntrophicum]|uniref:Glycosyltransferase n=1 Tax=Promethearchaeum syntrophicum TaxID=2594042 RepID=A0A5B9D9Z7_9ARCH|nr:glycosyltransferase [Candidatus Prometheoarchaeum syntrophicum]QEE16049.1 putative glycosyl transferase [Candidatus Prometheoarchaeum syntrophicum]
MKILILQETNWMLRGPHQQHHLMERLSAKGHEIRVIDFDFLWQEKKEDHKLFYRNKKYLSTPRISMNSKIQIIQPGMLKLPIFCYLSIPITHFLSIYKEIIRDKPDIIIGFSIINSFIGLILAKIYKIPFCYYLIDHLHKLLPIKLFQSLAKALESYNIRNCNNLFAINQGLLDYAYGLGGDPKKFLLIPGGVDLEKYKILQDSTETRLKLNISEEDTVLMFMGWIYNFSGMKEITDYVVDEQKTIKKIKLLIVGKGDLFNYIQEKKKLLNNKGDILLTGQVPFSDIPKYLHAADYCILPAYKNKIMENIVPIKLYEYLAAGKPVIATKLKGIFKEFGYNNGIIYIDNPLEVFDVVQKIQYKKHEISRSGLEFVKNYDWNIIIPKFENELYKIIGNPINIKKSFKRENQ